MREELKPCPFCGSPAHDAGASMASTFVSVVRCSNSECLASFKSVDQTIWNRRSIPQGDETAKAVDGIVCKPCTSTAVEFKKSQNLNINGAVQGDELPPLLSDGRIVTLACEEFVNPFDGADVIDFAKAIMREYGAACRAGRAKGEDARDAATIYREALEHAAFYVREHLQHGDEHYDIIASLKMPSKYEAAATTPEGKGENG